MRDGVVLVFGASSTSALERRSVSGGWGVTTQVGDRRNPISSVANPHARRRYLVPGVSTNFYILNEYIGDLLLGLRNKGFVAQYAWIIEAKYVKANAKPGTAEKVVEEGYQQIGKYVADRGIVEMLTLGKELKAGVLLFWGLKKVEFRPW